MTIRVHHTVGLPALPAPLAPRAGEAGPWLGSVRGALRERLASPLLRTLDIVDIDLQPHGEAYWAPATRRVAVVSLAPGLCGYATVSRLAPNQRRELERALAGVCAVDAVALRPALPGRALCGDLLVVAGEALAALGLLSLLTTSAPGVCASVALGATTAFAGYALAPDESR
jgi:hypothetical protein